MNITELSDLVRSLDDQLRVTNAKCQRMERTAEAMQENLFNYTRRLEFLEKQMQSLQTSVNVMRSNVGSQY